VASSDFRRLAETLQSSPQMNTDSHRFSEKTPENLQIFAEMFLSQSLSSFWLFNDVPDVERRPTVSVNLFHHTVSDSANSFRGLLGANVILSDEKNHALNKLEGMSQH